MSDNRRGRAGGRGRGGRASASSGGRSGGAPIYPGGRGVGAPSAPGGRGGGAPFSSGGRGGGAGNTSTGGRGRGSGSGVSTGGTPVYQAPEGVVSTVTSELQQKLSLQASSSTSAVGPSTSVQPLQQPAPVKAEQPPQPLPKSSKHFGVPSRPGYGTIGKRCMVRANHFLVHVADRDLHHYDVTISPEVLSKKVCRHIMKQLYEDYKQSHLSDRRLAYDGRKGVYTAGPLPFSSKEFVVKLADNGGAKREREFKVCIKFAAKVDVHHLKQFVQSLQSDSPQETIHALDVVLRAPPSANYEVVGRSFFHPSLGERGLLADGLEYWKGYFQSLRPTQMGLSLNIDMSARAFYEPIYVSDYVVKYLNVRDLSRFIMSDRDRIKVKRVLKGVKVEVRHQGIRHYKISGLSAQPVKELMFSIDDTGMRTTVVDYFRQKYNIVLRYPLLPAIQAGNNAKPVYLPMEICQIVAGQRYAKKLNGRQVTEMLKATCQRPVERERTIKEIVKTNMYDADEMMKEFGIEVQNEVTTIEARVLPPPMLKYHESGRESRVDPRIGQWNMIDKKMVNGGKVDFWTCVNFSKIDPSWFCKGLVDMCCSKGMVFNPEPLVPFRAAHAGQIEKTLVEIHAESARRLATLGQQSKHLQLLIVIVPEVSGYYGKIKRVCETELDIVSQCCQPKNAARPNKQYFENVALKINVKVGGRNSVLEQAVQRRIPFLTDVPTIVFGADVTHPQSGEDSSPSIAAVVASMDWPEVTKYRGLVSAQPHRQEIIMDLYREHEDPKRGIVAGGMIRELLIAFRRSAGHKPGRIIFYRDGVSEGQFNQVLLEEMVAIRKACQSLEDGYLPRVTFVIVQKRHHTRLFPANHNDRNMTDKSGNILPGTVVDTKICHPTEFDFYLCSHAGIKGTSRPAHYHVLYDENRFTADAMHNLTNCLCYTYARCTRSVSIVPPAYYAHLAAFRARYYIEDDMSEIESTSGGGGGGRGTRDQTAAVFKPLPVIKDNVKDVMFYC